MDSEIPTEEIVRLHLTTTNLRLYQARREAGMTSPEFANCVGIKIYRYREIENLRVIPTEDEIISISLALNEPVDNLFPESLLDSLEMGKFNIPRDKILNEGEIKLLGTRALPLLTDGNISDTEDRLDCELLGKEIENILGGLSDRSRQVIIARFGLDGQESKTLEEVALMLGVTRSRIGQIESEALRKLRHPSRTRWLKFYL